MRPLMIDLCCGLGGASQAMVDRGWEVVRVDVLEDVAATVVQDIGTWSWSGRRPDLLWASPPCTQFSRIGMRQWYPDDGYPLKTLALIGAVARILAETRPRFFVLENVAGAIPFLGAPARRIGPVCLWGNPPFFLAEAQVAKMKRKTGKGARVRRWLTRSLIPYQVSAGLATAVEGHLGHCQLDPMLSQSRTHHGEGRY